MTRYFPYTIYSLEHAVKHFVKPAEIVVFALHKWYDEKSSRGMGGAR